jgi:hypothetical protein
MRVSVLNPFHYSATGVDMAVAMRGSTLDLASDIVPGLVKAGYVEILDEPPEETGGYEMRHMGRSKYAVFLSGVRLTSEPLDKDAARRFLDDHRKGQ